MIDKKPPINFQNLSREDQEAIIDIAKRIKDFKEGLKMSFNIAENSKEFNEMADNSCISAFYHTNIFDFKLDDQEAN